MIFDPADVPEPLALSPLSAVARLNQLLDGQGSWSVGREVDSGLAYCEITVDGGFWRWQAPSLEAAAARAVEHQWLWSPTLQAGAQQRAVLEAPTAV